MKYDITHNGGRTNRTTHQMFAKQSIDFYNLEQIFDRFKEQLPY